MLAGAWRRGAVGYLTGGGVMLLARSENILKEIYYKNLKIIENKCSIYSRLFYLMSLNNMQTD